MCGRFSTCEELSLANVLEAERKRPDSSFIAEPPYVATIKPTKSPDPDPKISWQRCVARRFLPVAESSARRLLPSQEEESIGVLYSRRS